MKIGIMQPYLFPYIGYYQLINAVDKFIFFDDVNFMKKGWVNRNTLLINNKIGRFTVPIQHPSQFTPINELFISENSKWKNKLLKTIKQNYKDAPQYNLIFPILESIINSNNKKISDLIYFSLIKINDYLNLSTPIVISSEIYHNQHLKGQERVLDICKREKADQYINAIGGQQLYDLEYFERNNIKLNFIQGSIPEYVQFQNDFISGLSIIDVLMFNSKEAVYIMLNDYKLV